MESKEQHLPVLFKEALDALSIRDDGIYIDATFGRGGHSAGILEQLGPEGRLIALDRDLDAIACAQSRFADESRFTIVHTAFDRMESVATELGVAGYVDGILLDLGISSPQIDEAHRGFSFQSDGPLDMRMDTTESLTAAKWLAEAKEAEIREVLRGYGEERFSGRIAGAIVRQRLEEPLTTTAQLAELVDKAVPTREKGKHPATRTFQALRIRVNRELEQLEVVLEQALRVVKPGGRIAVISFHSLEDRMVKRFFRHHATADHLPKGVPVMADDQKPDLYLIGKPVAPSKEEIAVNPRARSSRLRIAERSS